MRIAPNHMLINARRPQKALTASAWLACTHIILSDLLWSCTLWLQLREMMMIMEEEVCHAHTLLPITKINWQMAIAEKQIDGGAILGVPWMNDSFAYGQEVICKGVKFSSCLAYYVPYRDCKL